MPHKHTSAHARMHVSKHPPTRANPLRARTFTRESRVRVRTHNFFAGEAPRPADVRAKAAVPHADKVGRGRDGQRELVTDTDRQADRQRADRQAA